MMFDKTLENQESKHIPLYSQHRDDSIQRDIRITRFTVHTLGRLNQQSVRRTSTTFWLQTENG